MDWFKSSKKVLSIIVVIAFALSLVIPAFISSTSIAYAKTIPTLTYFVRLDPKVATSYNSYSSIAA